jgi:hypothetical protein
MAAWVIPCLLLVAVLVCDDCFSLAFSGTSARKPGAAKFRTVPNAPPETGAGVAGQRAVPVSGDSLEKTGVYVKRKCSHKSMVLSERLLWLQARPGGFPPEVPNPEVVEALRKVLAKNPDSRTALEWLAVSTQWARSPSLSPTPVEAWLHSGSPGEQAEKAKLWPPVQLTIHFEQQQASSADLDCRELAREMLKAYSRKLEAQKSGNPPDGEPAGIPIPSFSADHPGGVVSCREFKRTRFLLTPEQVDMPIPQEVIDDEYDRGRDHFMRQCSIHSLSQIPHSASATVFLLAHGDEIPAALAELNRNDGMETTDGAEAPPVGR